MSLKMTCASLCDLLLLHCVFNEEVFKILISIMSQQ